MDTPAYLLMCANVRSRVEVLVRANTSNTQAHSLMLYDLSYAFEHFLSSFSLKAGFLAARSVSIIFISEIVSIYRLPSCIWCNI